MNQPNTFIDTIVEKGKAYVDTRSELFTLQAVKNISTISSKIAWFILILCFGIMLVIFSGIGLALWLSNSEAHWHQGFFIVGAIFFGIILLLVLASKKIYAFITNLVIDGFFNDKKEKH